MRMGKVIVRLVFILLSGFFASPVYGDDYISPYIEQDGERYDFSHAFSSSELKISLNDKTVDGQWRVSVLSRGNVYVAIPFTIPRKGECVINPQDASWRSAMRKYDAELDRDLFEIEVRFYADDTFSECRTVRLALLPARPKMENVSFTYVYDWEWDDIYPNGKFSFNARSDGATLFFLLYTESFLPRSVQKPFFRFGETFEGNDNMLISYDADWGEWVKLEAANVFGTVASDDVICTTDYITDEKILSRIEYLEEKAGIQTVDHLSSSNVVITADAIQFDDAVLSASIYDMNGRCMVSQRDVDYIDMANMAKGFYILVYEDKESNINRIKFVKP